MASEQDRSRRNQKHLGYLTIGTGAMTLGLSTLAEAPLQLASTALVGGVICAVGCAWVWGQA